VEIFPEGIGAFYSLSDSQREEIGNRDVVMIDIGGRTTDICLLSVENMKRKVVESTSKAIGMLDIYIDFTNAINAEYGLSKDIEDAPNILKSGLYVYGERKDLKFTKDIILGYTEKIFKELNMRYPLKTSCVILTGGGSCLLWGLFKKQIPHIMLHDNYLLANAIGFKRIGENLWLKS
jgi:plasmid segregation protein ParM